MITSIKLFKEIYDTGLVNDEFELNEIKSLQNLILQTDLKVNIIKILGYGSTSIVGLTNINTVIKFCVIPEEVKLLNKSKKYNFDNIVKIINIYTIKYKTKNNRFANGWLIHKEYIPNLPKNIKTEIDLYEKNNFNIFNNKFNDTNVSIQLKNIYYNLKLLGLKNINHVDLNSDNIGIKNNKLILFDFLF